METSNFVLVVIAILWAGLILLSEYLERRFRFRISPGPFTVFALLVCIPAALWAERVPGLPRLSRSAMLLSLGLVLGAMLAHIFRLAWRSRGHPPHSQGRRLG